MASKAQNYPIKSQIISTSWPYRIVGVVGDPLQLRGRGEGVSNVSKVLQLLNIIKIYLLKLFLPGGIQHRHNNLKIFSLSFF